MELRVGGNGIQNGLRGEGERRGRESVIVFEVDYTLQAGGSALVTLATPTMGGPQFDYVSC